MGVIVSLISPRRTVNVLAHRGRKCTTLPFVCVQWIQMHLELEEMLNLRLVSKIFWNCIDSREYHIRAHETLFGRGTDSCYRFGCGNSSPTSVSENHLHRSRAQTCWWQCILHVYKIQARFGLSNVVVSTALSMLETILENYNALILSNPNSKSPDGDYELCACMLCFVASKYEDREPLNLNNIKFYSRNRIYPDDALKYELLLLSLADPSISLHDHNIGLFLDSLHSRYVRPDTHVIYRTFFKRALNELRFAWDFNRRGRSTLSVTPPVLVALVTMLFALLLSNVLRTRMAEDGKNKMHTFFPQQNVCVVVHAALGMDVSAMDMVPSKESFPALSLPPTAAAEMMTSPPPPTAPMLIERAIEAVTGALHAQRRRCRRGDQKCPSTGTIHLGGDGGATSAMLDDDISQPKWFGDELTVNDISQQARTIVKHTFSSILASSPSFSRKRKK